MAPPARPSRAAHDRRAGDVGMARSRRCRCRHREGARDLPPLRLRHTRAVDRGCRRARPHLGRADRVLEPPEADVGSSISYGRILENTSPNQDAPALTVLVNFVDDTNFVWGSKTSSVFRIPAGGRYALGDALSSNGVPPASRASPGITSTYNASGPRGSADGRPRRPRVKSARRSHSSRAGLHEAARDAERFSRPRRGSRGRGRSARTPGNAGRGPRRPGDRARSAGAGRAPTPSAGRRA